MKELTYTYQRTHEDLLARGYVLKEESKSGSRYYLREQDGRQARVSDHEPNQATREWMKSCKKSMGSRVRDIRVKERSIFDQFDGLGLTTPETKVQ